DHNEANDLGNAELSATDPLAGFKTLAQQVRAAGVTRIMGEVVIDARLWQPFDFREQFQVSPIFVNDDVIDVIIRPGQLQGQPARVDWRPKSAAFEVKPALEMGTSDSQLDIALIPELSTCIGAAACTGEIS